MSFRFQIDATDGKARAGRFFTPHGVVQTPVFMPVGTLEIVKVVPRGRLGTASRSQRAPSRALQIESQASEANEVGLSGGQKRSEPARGQARDVLGYCSLDT